MKVVHLNTHSYGGAAVVARRLHLAALAAGIDSQLVTKYGLRSDTTAQYLPLRNAWLLYTLRARSAQPQLYRLGKLVQRRLQHRNLANRPSGYEIFSPLNTRQLYADCTARFDPQVIHLHWIADFVDHAEFFAHNRQRRFVWTLHDMNPFTGGCHHADGCRGFVSGCAECPQLRGTIDPGYAALVQAAKRQALAVLRDDQLVITAPSQWLLELSRQSPVTGRFRHVHVPNPGLRVQDSPNAEELRRQLGLPVDRKIVLFVSDNLRQPRKGVDVLFAAGRAMARRDRIQFLGIGQPTDAARDLNIKFTGRVTDEDVLRMYYECADVMVNPSMMENSPLTIIEALSCGTPVIAFDVGGVRELVGPGRGLVLPERRAAALAHALEEALFQHTWDRAAIRSSSSARHDPQAVLGEFAKVYAELVTDE